MRRWLTPVIAIGCLIAAGCGGDAGPKRHRVSGEATFDGTPIPHGDVLFSPDASKGNSGPQGIAQIRDGKFDTDGEDGKGVAGGPTIVRITGLSGPGGKLLCEYDFPLELPREDSVQKLDVPKKGEARRKQGPDI